MTGLLLLRLRELVRRKSGGEHGQGLVEYALILLVIVIVLIITVAVIGQQVKNDYSNINNSYPQ